MNTTEISANRTAPQKKYEFEAHPMTLYPNSDLLASGARPLTVKDESEEAAARAKGYGDTPAAIDLSVASPTAQLSTQPAIQASYDMLKKQFEGTIKEFNVKFAQEVERYKLLESQYLELAQAHEDLQLRHQILQEDAFGKTPENPFARVAAE